MTVINNYFQVDMLSQLLPTLLYMLLAVLGQQEVLVLWLCSLGQMQLCVLNEVDILCSFLQICGPLCCMYSTINETVIHTQNTCWLIIFILTGFTIHQSFTPVV